MSKVVIKESELLTTTKGQLIEMAIAANPTTLSKSRARSMLRDEFVYDYFTVVNDDGAPIDENGEPVQTLGEALQTIVEGVQVAAEGFVQMVAQVVAPSEPEPVEVLAIAAPTASEETMAALVALTSPGIATSDPVAIPKRGRDAKPAGSRARIEKQLAKDRAEHVEFLAEVRREFPRKFGALIGAKQMPACPPDWHAKSGYSAKCGFILAQMQKPDALPTFTLRTVSGVMPTQDMIDYLEGLGTTHGMVLDPVSRLDVVGGCVEFLIMGYTAGTP